MEQAEGKVGQRILGRAELILTCSIVYIEARPSRCETTVDGSISCERRVNFIERFPESVGPFYVDSEDPGYDIEVLFRGDNPVGRVYLHRRPVESADRRRFVRGILQELLVDRRLALEYRVNGLGRDVAMLVVVEERGSLLPLKAHHINGVADGPVAIDDYGFLDGVTIGKILSEEIDEVLLVDFPAVPGVGDPARRLQLGE